MKQSNQILWELYQSYNCSQTDFCIMLGYKTHTTNMSQWLNGNLDLSYDQLEKFCNKLGKPLIIKLEKI
jgi:hypothetical protein